MRHFAINASVVLLGLGITLTLLWLLGGSTTPTIAAPACRPLQAPGDVITVCLSGGCDYATIQAAVDAASDGDIIKVAAGTYTDVNTYGGLAQVVYITKTVTIRGGYTTTNWTTPDPETNPTTLDTQGQGRVLYITGDPSADSGQAISPTVEGLHITGGDAAGLGGYTVAGDTCDAGGGVYVLSATASIKDNYVFSNSAEYGGGLFLEDSGATLNGNVVISNSAYFWAGGLWLGHSGSVTVTPRVPYFWADGLLLADSDATLVGNTIAGNTASVGGGLGLYDSDAVLDRNAVTANTAGVCGGILLAHSDATLSGNTVTHNIAESQGGGLCLSVGSPTLINNIVSDNETSGKGSGIYVDGGASPRLLHTTVARNSGGDGSGVHIASAGRCSSAALTNTILVSHTVGIVVASGSTATLEATLWGSGAWANGADWGDVGTITTGTINIWGDPAFVDPDAGDYHISIGSAAVDAGVDTGVTTDVDGHPRPIGAGFDMGADECTVIDLSPSSKTVSPRKAGVGETLTYTIVLLNNGTLSATDTVLFDPIPISTIYVPGSAQATSGVFTGMGGVTGTLVYTGTLIYPDGVRWTGAVTPDEAITITFRATVSESVFIENTAVVTDRYGTPTTLTAWANANRVYLPLILRRFRPQASMLGVALEGYNSESGLEKALELGVHWVRRWQHISWRDVEPNEGEYHWDALAGLESELLRARASNTEPIIWVHFTPEWAQQVVPYTCGPIRADKFEAFAGFVEQLVTRYGSASPYGVRYWQLGNEMDRSPEESSPEDVFGCWGDLNDPYYGGGHYAEMLKVVYPRVKAADPQAQILLGGLLLECDPYVMTVDDCSTEQRWKSGFFLEGVMQAGGGDYFDVADVHSYAEMRLDLPARMHSLYAWSGDLGGTGLPEKVAFFRQVMGDYGHGDKPVFAGEMALKCEEPTAECYEVAAAFVPRAYAEAYGLNLLGGVYYTLISPDSYASRYKGLLFPDFTPRPAFWAYKSMSSQLIGAQYEGPVTEYAGVSGYEFDKGEGQRVQIVWSTGGADQVIDVPVGFVGAYDKYGAALTPDAGRLIAGWSPIYIVLEQGTTE